MANLRLEVCEFEGLGRWRWRLIGQGGELLADHEVRLDTRCWQFEAFTDLLAYLRWHAAPDRRIEDEARIVAEVGEWIGAQVLGPVGRAVVEARPATVRVVVPSWPEQARWLMFRPLELAHLGGMPLALQDVTLVMQLGSDVDASDITPIGARLRVLGLFSLPVGGQPLNLRRERHALVRLLSGVAAAGRAADVRVLQYGVTRARLREVLEEDEGWDIVHVSGHGAPGELLLETEDGSPEPVTAGDLAGLLDMARDRLKLVSVSACWSAALTVSEQRRLLGLPTGGSSGEHPADAPGPPSSPGAADPPDAAAFAPGALASELATKLGCAVLAMRYPVTDDFAIALARKLYDLLADKGRPLPRALGMALNDIVAQPATLACPALSVTTPALFGARAVDLRLAAPRRPKPESYDTAALKMAAFPPQPDRFVGRTGLMARASAALAQESRVPGVLLHGMPGGGKSACALELAYTHEHVFDRLVWFKAPDEGCDITGALTGFALTLEARLPDFQMVHVLHEPALLAAFLPQLTELLQRRRVLIVIDNMESLLSQSGQWRDDRWGKIITAMTAHTGLGRMVLTSRRIPPIADSVQVDTVDALSLDEALLLARELPHLRDLMDGELPGVDQDIARALAVGVLNIAQGHPKLLELADGQAADLDRLSALVHAGDLAWQEAGGLPDDFFAVGQPQASDEDYLHVLGAWTRAVAADLAPGNRDLFFFLCCLEEGDRVLRVLQGSWASLWRLLSRRGQPPNLDVGLAALAAHGLIAMQSSAGRSPDSYAIHPGVAAAGRAEPEKAFRGAVDTQLAFVWASLAKEALTREGKAPTTWQVVQAGLHATPYLLRLGQWQVAQFLLEQALGRDRSRATAAAALPALRVIAAAASGTEAEHPITRLLANTIEVIDPAAAEPQIRALLAAALARGDYPAASVAAADLVRYHLRAGRLAEALALAEEQIRLPERARFGPWTRLNDEAMRLYVLVSMGNAEQVLPEVHRLRAHMETLPEAPEQEEVIDIWHVREMLLIIEREAALHLGRWQDGLDANAAVVASGLGRGAPATWIARARFNDYSPLLRLGRLDDAFRLLLECRAVFEQDSDIQGLGCVFSAFADLESMRGQGEVALDMEGDALRYSYIARDTAGVATSHYNLGNYLARHAHRHDTALAHHLAAALIRAIAQIAHLDSAAQAASQDLRALHDEEAVPTSVAELSQRVAEQPGADLGQLLTSLSPDPQAVQQHLEDLIARVRANAAAVPPASDPAT